MYDTLEPLDLKDDEEERRGQKVSSEYNMDTMQFKTACEILLIDVPLNMASFAMQGFSGESVDPSKMESLSGLGQYLQLVTMDSPLEGYAKHVMQMLLLLCNNGKGQLHR